MVVLLQFSLLQFICVPITYNTLGDLKGREVYVFYSSGAGKSEFKIWMDLVSGEGPHYNSWTAASNCILT